MPLAFDTFEAALSPAAGFTDSTTVVFSTFPGAALTVVFFVGFCSGSRKSSARFLIDLLAFAGAATVASSFWTLVDSAFFEADFEVGFSTVVVLTFLVVTLGSVAPVA